MKSSFEEMNGTYYQMGDYLLPNLALPESIPVGIWDQRRRHYLKTQQESIYTVLFLSGKLDSHLAEIDVQAETSFFQLVKQIAEYKDIAEQLKAENQLKWVSRMNSVRNRAEEIINNKIIFV